MGGDDKPAEVKNEPWEALHPYIAESIEDAQARYEAAKAYPDVPPFLTTAPFNKIQKHGQQLLLDYADTQLPELISGVGESYEQLLNPGNEPVYAQSVNLGDKYRSYLQDVMAKEPEYKIPNVEEMVFAQNLTPQVGSGVQQGRMYGTVGNFDVPSVGRPNVRQPSFNIPGGFGINAPTIDFNRSVAENETLTDTLNRMMSGEVAMDIWQPLMDQMSKNMTRDFTEQVMPHVRTQAMSAGAYGQSMGQRGTGLAADRFTENLAESMERIVAQGGIQALQQQQAGARLATDVYGMDLDAELRRALGQGTLDMDTLRLREAQRSALAAEDISRNRLAIDRDLGLSRLSLDRDLGASRLGLDRSIAMENAAIQRSQLGFEADRWQDQLQRDLSIAGLQAGLGKYTADVGAGTDRYKAELGAMADKYRADLAGGLTASEIMSREAQNMYQLGLGARTDALRMAGAMAELGAAPSLLYEKVGDEKYERQQRLLDEHARRWWQQHPTQGTAAKNQEWYQQMIGQWSGYPTTTTTGGYQEGNPLTGALGGGTTGAAIYGALPEKMALAGGWPLALGMIGGGAIFGGFGSI